MKNFTLRTICYFFSVLLLQLGINSISTGQTNTNIDVSNSMVEQSYREKIYVHTDKKFYTAGDLLWFKAYLLNGNNNMPNTHSEVMYVNLISPEGELISKKCLKTEMGGCEGDFLLPINLPKGKYTLLAYTNFMKNFEADWFFNRTIIVNEVRAAYIDSIQNEPILIAQETTSTGEATKPDVQFFPEGGNLVNGLLNRVGVKSVASNGFGIDIGGSIYDNNNDKILDFATAKFGIGSFNFVPQSGKSYTAKVSLNGNVYTYSITLAKKHGAILRVLEEDSSLNVVVRTTLPTGINGFTIIASQRGTVINTTELQSKTKGVKIKLPKDSLQEGIIMFTLLNMQGHPICERLYFYEQKNDSTAINLTCSQQKFAKQEKVDLNLDFYEDNESDISSNLSLSVANVSASNAEHDVDIRTHLLLNSELRGYIEEPGFYFYSNHPKRKQILDQLMMTQGWRRYNWEYHDHKPIQFHYKPESNLSIQGTVCRMRNKRKKADALLQLICTNTDGFIMYETEPDDDGRFSFDGLMFSDSSQIVIQAKKMKSNTDKMNYHIEIDSIVSPKCRVNSPSFSNAEYDSYPKSALSEGEIDSLLRLLKDDIWLDEIVIKSKRIEPKEKKRTLYSEPNHTFDFKKIKPAPNLSILEAINGHYPGAGIPGTSLIRADANSSESFWDDPGEGVSTYDHEVRPLFLLDGTPVDKDAIITLPIEQVDFVDIIKGPKAVILGGTGGARPTVIAVYTLTANEFDYTKKERRGIVTFIHPGFSKNREFYNPQYSAANTPKKLDKRVTLYWNPNVNLTCKQNQTFSFYTGDIEGKYKVRLEGITSEGEPIVLEQCIEVQ